MKALAISAATLALAASASAQSFTATDGPAQLLITGNFDSNLPNANLVLDGTSIWGTSDKLAALHWSYRTPIIDNKTYLMSGLMSPAVTQPAPNTLVYTWLNNGPGTSTIARFNATLTITLTAGPTPGTGIVNQTMVFQAHPTNTAPQTFELLSLVDLDLGGTSTNNTATITPTTGPTTASYTCPGTDTGQVAVSATGLYQAGQGYALRQIMSRSVSDLVPTTTYTGDAATAFGWYLTLAPGASRTITSNFAINMPLTAATCDANCDGSATAPVLGPSDFSCFLAKYRAGDSYANCDGSTTAPVLGPSDFSCFLTRYRAGCP